MAAGVNGLRVLMVSDVSPLARGGGAERVLWEHARGLAAAGHAVRVLSRATATPAPAIAERDGVRLETIVAGRAGLRRLVRATIVDARRAVDGALAREGADVVNVHQPLTGYGALRAAAARGVPALYTFLSPAPLEYRARRRMTRLHVGGAAGAAVIALLWALEGACLRRASRIAVLSEYSAGQLWRLYRVPRDRIVKIPGGVDTERFRPAADREAVRARLGLPAGRPLVLTVRNLEARMGLDALLRAMAIARLHVPDALLLVGGQGSLGDELRALGVSLGLAHHVRFLGWIDDAELPSYYQAADCFVLPTRALEGFGLVTVEALACGTPVLGSAVGATPELLAPLDPALVLADASAEGIAEALRRLLAAKERDAAAMTALRAACRAHAERFYTWRRSVAVLDAELQALARPSAPPSSGAPACPACGGVLAASALVYRARRFTRCAVCRTRAIEALPDEAELRRRYEVEYPARFAPEAMDGARRAMLGSLLDRLRRAGGRGRLLDVGCGGGHMIADAAARGWTPLGTDVGSAACAAARRVVGAPVVQADAGRLPVRAGSVDAVTLVNVIDHLAAPAMAVHEAWRVLRPGGLLALRVPNGAVHAAGAGLLARLGPLVRGRGWDAWPILHVFAFGPRALRRLVERAGFDVVEIANSLPATEGRVAGAVTRAVAGALASASRGHWLVGPSLELVARKPDAERP